MFRAIALSLIALALSSCATVQYTTEFRMNAAAQYHAGGKFFRAWQHRDPSQHTILLTGGVGQAARSGLVSGLTMGLVTGNSPYEQWNAGAHWLVDQTPCQVQNLRPIDQTTTWAFDYSCPEGFDMQAFLAEHRDQLLRGGTVR